MPGGTRIAVSAPFAAPSRTSHPDLVTALREALAPARRLGRVRDDHRARLVDREDPGGREGDALGGVLHGRRRRGRPEHDQADDGGHAGQREHREQHAAAARERCRPRYLDRARASHPCGEPLTRGPGPRRLPSARTALRPALRTASQTLHQPEAVQDGLVPPVEVVGGDVAGGEHDHRPGTSPLGAGRHGEDQRAAVLAHERADRAPGGQPAQIRGRPSRRPAPARRCRGSRRGPSAAPAPSTYAGRDRR